MSGEESVSRIHNRFYLTLISPASHLTSLLISFFCASLVIVVSYVYYLDLAVGSLAVALPASLAVLYVGMIIDFALLRSLPVTKLTKIYHTAAFASLLWLLTAALGVASAFVFGRAETGFHFIVEGMLLAVGLRIGIFVSVFGASLPRAVAVSPILPLIFLASFVPIEQVPLYLSDPVGLGFGLGLVAIVIVWSVIADRAGKPRVTSTFKLLQAYLLAWTEHNPQSMESVMEKRAHESRVSTYTLAFESPKSRSLIVVPDIHPGPFHPVGGSNLPYEICQAYSKDFMNAVVMHSISDHSLNLPSKAQVERYLSSLGDQKSFERGNQCTEPIVIQVNKARVTALGFGKVAVLMLSMAPHGMEDVPEVVRREVEEHARSRGFNHVLVIDTHNSMGKHMDEDESSDMIKACRVALEELVKKPQQHFKFGFCNSSEIGARAGDLGPAGMSAMAISLDDTKSSFAIGWADSNNMARGLRERIVSHLAENGVSMLEICTSDTHHTSGRARNRTGYFTFGSLSSPETVSGWYLEMARRAAANAEGADYDLIKTSSEVKIMGREQFSDYSNTLDRAMNITKVSIGVTVAVYIAMLVVG
ncbi:MAG: DUF2070 family protein [Nitrososphaerales archaeon]